MKKNNIKGSIILSTAALLWGLAFVAQSDAASKIPSFGFNAIRSFIGALFLVGILFIKNKKAKIPFFPKEKEKRKDYFMAAFICGSLLTVSVNFQQFGLAFYPQGVASEARGGFITALYVVLVPVIGLFIGKKTSPVVWLSVLIAMVGIYMLCLSGGIDSLYLGDILIFICSVCFAIHLLFIDKYAVIVGGIKLSILQFTVCGIFSTILSLIFETMSWQNVLDAAPQILYLGIASSGIAYTLQIIGQKYAEPAVASISMSLESVFSALGGWLISGNTLTLRECFGCALVFIAIIVAQTPEFLNRKKLPGK